MAHHSFVYQKDGKGNCQSCGKSATAEIHQMPGNPAYLVAVDVYANRTTSWATRQELEDALRLVLRALDASIVGKPKGDEAIRLLRGAVR